MPTILNNSRPNITVTATSVETPVYTVTIPGGTLGTSGRVFGLLLGFKVKNTGGVENMTFRLYYGSALIGVLKPDTVDADSAEGVSVQIEFQILADGAVNAQIAHSKLASGKNVIGGGGMSSTSLKTAAVDSSVNQDFKITYQQALASTEHAYTSQSGLVAVL